MRTALAALLAASALSLSPAAAQEKVLRIAMTAADIPRTLGQPDQGFEGNRFTEMGHRFEPLIADAYAEREGVALETCGTTRHTELPHVFAVVRVELPAAFVHPGLVKV